jgi:hypothetical protein
MAFRIEPNSQGNDELIIDGFENGIANSPYEGIANIRNLNTSYYPGVTYVNYRRRACTISGGTMTNPVQKATSPLGLNYILDDSGQIWKQNSVNSSTFTLLVSSSNKFTNGSAGIAYWQNYLVVFGNNVIEFCGDGTGDLGIISANWNKTNYGSATNNTLVTTVYASFANNIYTTTILNKLPIFQVNSIVRFTTTNTLPAGLSLNTDYYILSISTNSDYITISTAPGGSAVILTSDGTGVHTMTSQTNPLPIGNSTTLLFSVSGSYVGATTATIISYIDVLGKAHGTIWAEATGIYNIVMPDGQKIATNFTNNSTNINFLSALLYLAPGATANWSIQLLDPTATFYRPYVSKVDGSLYFCNGQFIGRIATTSNTNINFNPALPESYSVSFGVASIPEQFIDTVTDLTDLKSQMVVAGQQDIYTWDYVSAQTSSPSPIGEKISGIINLLNNIYVFAGQKGNIYVSNGYSVQLLYKIPDFVAGVIDPVFAWGGIMVHRSRLFFQLLITKAS